MATYTTFSPGTTTPTRPLNTSHAQSTFDVVVDFSEQNAAQNDVFNLAYLPAGVAVESVGVDVETATNAASDLDIGFTGGDVDVFVDGLDASSTGKTIGLTGAVATTAVRTIALLCVGANALTSGKIRVRFVLSDVISG